MTEEQYYLIRDMQELLVKYIESLDDLRKGAEVNKHWKEFIRTLDIDIKRLSLSASGTLLWTYTDSVIELAESLKKMEKEKQERKEAELKHKKELQHTQYWKRKKKGNHDFS